MKKFYLMTTAGLLAMAATPATAQVSLPTEPDLPSVAAPPRPTHPRAFSRSQLSS